MLKGGTKLLKGGTKLLKGGTKLLKGGTKLLKGGTKSLGWATGGGSYDPPDPPPLATGLVIDAYRSRGQRCSIENYRRGPSKTEGGGLWFFLFKKVCSADSAKKLVLTTHVKEQNVQQSDGKTVCPTPQPLKERKRRPNIHSCHRYEG